MARSSDESDPPIVISDSERVDFRKRRDALGLSTRALAKLAKTSNGTITNIENGDQTTAKRSLYVSLVRVLFRASSNEAEEKADEAIERSNAAVKRLSRALAGLTADQIESMAVGAESIGKKPR
jgi:transcriptional regulator with XRE-family HTH domain